MLSLLAYALLIFIPIFSRDDYTLETSVRPLVGYQYDVLNDNISNLTNPCMDSLPCERISIRDYMNINSNISYRILRSNRSI